MILPTEHFFAYYSNLLHPSTHSHPPAHIHSHPHMLYIPHTQPLFITLSQVWSGFYDEVDLLSVVRTHDTIHECVCVCVYVRCLLYIVWVCKCVG